MHNNNEYGEHFLRNCGIALGSGFIFGVIVQSVRIDNKKRKLRKLQKENLLEMEKLEILKHALNDIRETYKEAINNFNDSKKEETV